MYENSTYRSKATAPRPDRFQKRGTKDTVKMVLQNFKKKQQTHNITTHIKSKSHTARGGVVTRSSTANQTPAAGIGRNLTDVGTQQPNKLSFLQELPPPTRKHDWHLTEPFMARVALRSVPSHALLAETSISFQMQNVSHNGPHLPIWG